MSQEFVSAEREVRDLTLDVIQVYGSDVSQTGRDGIFVVSQGNVTENV